MSIWLKDLNNMVRQFKESDSKTVDAFISSGRWVRVKDKKDLSNYVAPAKKATKKSK